MQGFGCPVSAVGQGEQAGPQSSSSCDCSSTLVGNLVSVEYNATRIRSTPHRCNGKSNFFCYVCGKYHVKKSNLRKFTNNLKLVYEECFGCKVIEKKQYWLPQLICNRCRFSFERYKNNKTPLQFVRPMIWSEPESVEDCYFCMIKTVGFNSSNVHNITYASVSSATKPSEDHVAPTEERDKNQESYTFSLLGELEVDTTIEVESESEETNESGDEYMPVELKPEVRGTFDQKELNDIVRELGLSKEGAEFLASRLKEKNLLTNNSHYRNRDESFRKYFSTDTNLVYCHDVMGLMDELKKDVYKAEEWRLFINSSMRSLKAVLLHNTNKYASIPIAHSVTMKEEYKNIEILLNKIQYKEHNWLICGDLKILAIILGQQSGFTKFPMLVG
ncbi:hypothetical protein ALC57_02551 [Trachymyrmex cornetzi]|uniref:Uncharacterized protein n=1 Tax=Trachymyrmex cornetzi TaxID=471704 RepID=A0A151JNM5_9HYME|nr:hypothetical protein ALC57_02551 [Trachymyrmex cornetzi]